MKRLFYFLLILLFPVLTHAQWSSNPAENLQLSNLPGEDVISKTALCPNGDVYVGYFALGSGNYNIRLQRLDHQGNILWDQNGILISDHPSMSWLTDWDMTADLENHAIMTWQDIRNGGNNNIVAYRISPEGDFVWGEDGLSLSNSTAFDAAPKVTVTASNNTVIAWQSETVIIRHKISPDGSLLWGEDGITMSGLNQYTWPQLIPVGEDDVIMKYFEDSGPPNAPTRHVFAQRFTSDGSAVWTQPAVITNQGGISAWTQIFPMINDGNDGFYISWHEDRAYTNLYKAYVQHIDQNGNAMFEENGQIISFNTTMNHFYPQLAKPENDPHIYVLWNLVNMDQNQWGLAGQKISPTGDLKWGDNGKTLIPLSTKALQPHKGLQHGEDIILIYEDYFNSIETSLKAMRLDANGDFVWENESVFISSVQSTKIHLDISDWHQNQWVMSWEDERGGNPDIYVQNLLPSGELGPAAINGTLSGTISLVNGTADLSLTEISIGESSTFADADGNYSISVAAGTYTVTATHPYAEIIIVEDVEITENETTTLNFELNVNRTDLIVRAVDQYGSPLFPLGGLLQADFSGPEGTYSGVFDADTLVFEQVLYGDYEGTAFFELNIDTVEASATIDAENNELIFVFILGSVEEQNLSVSLKIAPNPLQQSSQLFIYSETQQKLTLQLIDQQGNQLTEAVRLNLNAGNNSFGFYALFPAQKLKKGVYHLVFNADSFRKSVKFIVR
ncbi:MAG: T9SS type A sorting domain-containing protein [Bacteroidales bacterium]|nr:T9SS type A sorting domain-containing protein [Bacteroidales bacterium]